jgi:hypothetical protein
MWTALAWIGAGVIGLFVFAFTASARPLDAMLRALRCLAYWIAVVLGTTLATALAGSLIEWTPGHGLRVEMLSLVLRVSAVAIVDATLICLLLAILATCVLQAEAIATTSAGIPDESQPRTDANP